MSDNLEERLIKVAEKIDQVRLSIEAHSFDETGSTFQEELIRAHGGRRHGRFVAVDGWGGDPTEALLKRPEQTLLFHTDTDPGDEDDAPSKLVERFELGGYDMDVVNDDFDPRGLA